jgi:hypothetical protein
MTLFTRIAALICLSAAFSFAESWSGSLVDSGCFSARERNRNPTDTLIYADRDTNEEIRYCSPSAKTKSFAVVQPDGTILELDSAGNAKAAELVRSTGRRSRFSVAVTGEMRGRTLRVDSISAAH